MKSNSYNRDDSKKGVEQTSDLNAAELTEAAVSQSSECSSKSMREDAWVSLGCKLRTAREQKGLSIVELADQTHVHTRFIKAFEAGRDLGLAETYSRGYLKLLANGLDLCAVELLESYQAGLGAIALKDQNAHCGDTKTSLHGASRTFKPTHSLIKKRAMIKTPLDHIQQVCSEALGALISLFSGLKVAINRAVPKTSGAAARRTPLQGVGSDGPVKSQASTSTASVLTKNSAVNKKTTNRPTALMASGSSWATSAWSPFSWFGFINGAVVSVVIVGVIVASSIQMQDIPVDDASGERLIDSKAITSSSGELASSAIADDSGERSLLNGEERRAALAMLDLKEASNSISDVKADATLGVETQRVAKEGGERQITASVDLAVSSSDAESRFAAIEAKPDAYAESAVTSVISLGNVFERNSTGRVASSTQFADSFEPVGPGAEYMVSQYAAQDRLVISVYEDSWVDVRDADGVSLYRALAKAGRRIDLNGELPFSLHVGNAPGLGLELNGEYVPIERYRSDNSARLTLASSR